MEPKPRCEIDIGWPSVFADFVHLSDLDRSFKIDSQAEVSSLANRVWNSANPMIQKEFQRIVVPQAQKCGWEIPTPFRNPLMNLLNQSKNRDKKIGEPIGTVLIQTPYYIDLQEIDRAYPILKGSILSTNNGDTQRWVDEAGAPLLEISFEEEHFFSPLTHLAQIFHTRKVTHIASPLTREALSAALLWFPGFYRQELSDLLGLPEPLPMITAQYNHERWLLDDTLPQVAVDIEDPTYDPYCNVTRDPQDRRPRNIREAIKTQCGEKPDKISFPAFSVTDPSRNIPTLGTMHLYTCIGLLIYEPISKRALMAHLLTENHNTDEGYYPPAEDLLCLYNMQNPFRAEFSLPATLYRSGFAHSLSTYRFGPFTRQPIMACRSREFPYEWYIGTFKKEYFPDTDHLEITVISSYATRESAKEVLSQSLRDYFPEAHLRFLEVSVQIINFQFDPRNNQLHFQQRHCVERWCGDEEKNIDPFSIHETTLQEGRECKDSLF